MQTSTELQPLRRRFVVRFFSVLQVHPKMVAPRPQQYRCQVRNDERLSPALPIYSARLALIICHSDNEVTLSGSRGAPRKVVAALVQGETSGGFAALCVRKSSNTKVGTVLE